MEKQQQSSSLYSAQLRTALEGHIDLAHLRRFTLGDLQLERELLDLFRIQTRAQLEVANTTDDPAEFKMAIHTLKGTARTIGAFAVSAASEALEQLTSEPAVVRSSTEMRALRRAVEALQQAFGPE